MYRISSRTKYIIIIFGFILIISLGGDIVAAPKINKSDNSGDFKISDFSEDPYLTIRVHNNGKIALTISNTGCLGIHSPYSLNNDPETGLPAPSCEYPKGSGIEYLYGGYLWVGGVIGNDTAVSVSGNGWHNTCEFWPKPFPDGDMKVRYLNLNETILKECKAIYYDTLTASSTWQGIDEFSNNFYHRPLGLEVTQTSYSWSTESAEDFIIIKYSIKNIDTLYIQNGWAGIMLDADIGFPINESMHDDIAGYLNYHKITYITDNDGDPRDNSSWIADSSGRAAIGVKLLDFYPTNDSTNFAWFAMKPSGPNFTPLKPKYNGDLPECYLQDGDIMSIYDRDSYYYLSHDEIDYDQLWANINSDQDGWLPPTDYCDDIADGYDTRFLLSFGPFNLLPDDSIYFTIALVMGDNVHVEPDDFEKYFDDKNPLVFFNKLDFSDLINNVNVAEAYYNQYIRGLTDITGEQDDNELPKRFYLSNNYPNPFNVSTTIKYSVPQKNHISLSIYNLLGQHVRTLMDEIKPPGVYSIKWNGKDENGIAVATGFYFYQLKAGNYIETKGMLLLK